VRTILILWHIDLLLGNDLETNMVSDPFLSNGSVKTLPWKQDTHNNTVNNGKWGVFFVVCAKELKRRQLGQLSSVDRSSVWGLSTEAEE
jgi:hypothetical protein